MILRSLIVGVLFVVDIGVSQNVHTFDSTGWIPLDQPCETCFEGAGSEDVQRPQAERKQAQGRVLNLASPNQRAFFPEEIQFQKNQQPIVNGQFHQERVLPPQFLQSAPKPRFGPQLLQPGPQQFAPQRGQFGGQAFLPPQPSFRQPPNVIRGEDGLNYFISNVPNQPIISNGTSAFGNLGIRELNQAFNAKPVPDYSQLEFTTPSPQLDRKRPQAPPQQQQQQQQQEQVQLVYVPLENLRPRGEKPIRPQSSDQVIRQNLRPFPSFQEPIPKQVQIQNIQEDFAQQSLQAQQFEEQFLNQQPFIPALEIATQPTTSTTTTTQSPKKRKPHQPPLAVYMGASGNVKITDVLNLLKDAKSIAVQDTVGPDSPQVFVGPSNLDPPEGFVKFELPYLSSLDSNRIERKTDQLPFFVAPLSYKAPTGYSKIPFPAPHVGSVVVSQPKQPLHDKLPSEPREPSIRQPLRPSPEFNSQLFTSSRGQLEPSTTVRYQFEELEQVNPIPQTIDDHRFSQQSFSTQDFTRPRFQETTSRYITQTTPTSRPTTSRTTTRQPPQEEFVPVTQTTPVNSDKYTILEDFTAGQGQRTTTPLTGPRFVQTNPEILNSAFAPESHTSRRPQVVTEQPVPERLIPSNRFFPSAPPQEIQYVPISNPESDFRPQKEEIVQPQRVRQGGNRYLPDPGSRYNVPSELPAINAHLPGLINSLQDQELRPLLNPNLLAPSAVAEEQPVQTEQSIPVYSTTTTTTTPEPITTTTEAPTTTTRRSRGRQRVVTRAPTTGSTTISSRRNPVNRGRRPYTRTTTERPDDNVRVASSTTENYPDIAAFQEVSRTNVVRNRFQSTDSTTEQPRRTSNGVRQRFRTRGRPANSDDSATATSSERTNADSRSLVQEEPEDLRQVPIYRQQPAQQTVESYMEFDQQTGIDGDIVVRKQPVEASTPATQYILLEEKAQNVESQTAKPTPKVYFQEAKDFQEQVVDNKLRQPSVLINPVEDTQYIRVVATPQREQPKEIRQEAVEVTTPRSPITRGRGRHRLVRPRVGSTTPATTTTQAPLPPSRKTTAEEDEEEYYGFIRKPDYNRPAPAAQTQPQAANKYSSRLSEGNLISTPNVPVQYSTPKSLPHQVYVDDKSTNLYVEVYTNDQQQSSTLAPQDAQASSTKLFSPSTETVVTDRQYTVEQGPIETPTRSRVIRPRTRIATRPQSTTEYAPAQHEHSTRRSFRTRTRPSASNEVTEEPAATPARGTRARGRGKSQYRPPKAQSSSSDEDVEGGNYPPNFLRSLETQTQRSGFKITVEPNYEESKDDQLPYSSIHRPRYVSRDPESGGEESQWTPGSAATYNNIPFEDERKPSHKLENESNFDDFETLQTPEAPTITTTEPSVPVTTDEAKTETQPIEAETVTTPATPEAKASSATETPAEAEAEAAAETETVPAETTTATPKPKGRRRGVWKLVKKPMNVDFFETAESQNVPSSINAYETDKESIKKDEEQSKTHVNKGEHSSTTTESNLFDSLYEMFGLDDHNSPQPVYEISESAQTTTTPSPEAEDITTIVPQQQQNATETTQTTTQKVTETTTENFNDISKIIGTSTTTEISHETEICYRGRCIKSTTES